MKFNLLTLLLALILCGSAQCYATANSSRCDVAIVAQQKKNKKKSTNQTSSSTSYNSVFAGHVFEGGMYDVSGAPLAYMELTFKEDGTFTLEAELSSTYGGEIGTSTGKYTVIKSRGEYKVTLRTTGGTMGNGSQVMTGDESTLKQNVNGVIMELNRIK